MKAQKLQDTGPEIALRSCLHEMGLRFRLGRRLLPKSRRLVDITFIREKVAVLVDGCFWHGCPIHATWPKANAEFWRSKIEANQRRDADTTQQLTLAGWAVVRVWEHEDPDEAARRIALLVLGRRAQGRGS